MSESSLPEGYSIRRGDRLDRALLVKFMQQTYQEFDATVSTDHLALTVEQYFSNETPLWWVYQQPATNTPANVVTPTPIACLWMGNAVDQISGDRHAHIFLLYVAPEQRQRGIGAALMQQAEQWARERGDRQIGLQVFCRNEPALTLYRKLGFQAQSVWMVKSLS